MKLALRETEVTLIEANAKKAAFLGEVIRALRLSGVRVVRERTESIKLSAPLGDCITSRAVGRFPSLLGWCAKALEPGGKVILWVAAIDAGAIRSIGGWGWQNPISLPGSERRVLMVGCSTWNAL